MGNQQTHIEINGKRYDARTGKLLASDAHIVTPAHKSAPQPTRHISEVTNRVASKQVHSTTQRSNTLMRHGVKKPSVFAAAKPSSSKTMLDVITPVSVPIKPTLIYKSVDPVREQRALKVKRSALVSKFNNQPQNSRAQAVPTKVEHLPVAAEPTQNLLTHAVHKSAASSIISKALNDADSHKQPKHHSVKTKKRGRLATLALSGMTVFLLAGFIAYQNVPNISMRYASSRAGLTAKSPGYQPSGFSLNNQIKYLPGQITLSFTSNTDERQFTITQKESNWNSEALKTNYVAATDSQIQTYEDNGRTIYLYGDSSATWVNGGVWYDIKGDSSLNSDQLIRIANSL